MRSFGVILLFAINCCLTTSAVQPANTSQLFDKPLRESHISLPKDPDNPQAKPVLSCFYYHDFMVKQYDLGEMGAEQLSILHYDRQSKAIPICQRNNVKDEIVIDPMTWGGYFDGVKGDFVFFRAEDGFHGGLGFAVFNGESGRKIFEDEARFEKNIAYNFDFQLLNDSEMDSNNVIKMRYRRIYPAQCSLRVDEKKCWALIQQITGLAQTTPPNCRATYESLKKQQPQYANTVDLDPSVITYEVEAVLSARDDVLRVTPTSNVIECYPAD